MAAEESGTAHNRPSAKDAGNAESKGAPHISGSSHSGIGSIGRWGAKRMDSSTLTPCKSRKSPPL